MQFSISIFVLSSGVAIVPVDNKPMLVRCENPKSSASNLKKSAKRAIVIKYR